MMVVKMTLTEAELLIAALTAIEQQREFPPSALVDLRQFRSSLLEKWLKESIARFEASACPLVL